MQYMIIESYRQGPLPRALLDQWMQAWSDIVDFEVLPVIGSAEAAARFG